MPRWSHVRWWTLALALVVVGSPAAAAAQDVPLGEFSVMRMYPAPGPLNYVAADGASVGAGTVLPSFGLLIDYAHNPLTLYNASCDASGENCEVTDVRAHLVEYIATAHLTASISLIDRVQIGLVFPLALTNGERLEEEVGGMPFAVGGQQTFGLGDPQLSAKLRIFGDGRSGFGLAARAYVNIPLAQAVAPGAYLGDATARVGGHAIAELGIGRLHVAANLGGFWREQQVLFSTSAGSQLTFLGAAAVDITPLLSVLAEVDWAASFGSQVDENPLELRGAIRLAQGDFTFQVGGGAGLVLGVGVPTFRAFGGLVWAPIRRDQDGDGILDSADGCPNEAEDLDGWFDDDGCPENDNDNDGKLDADDPCPNEAEDRDNHEDEDGCPDPDNDGDGVPDGYDSCPEQQEDMDGDRDEDGCLDDDTDRDGIADPQDACPNEPEDTDGYGDEDGCPETDFDGDGIPDDGDACPDQPEIINGVEDEDGCPEVDTDGDGIPDPVDRCPNERETLNGRQDDDGCPDGDELVRVEGTEIRLLQQVQFRTNSAQIRGARSFQILDAVGTILRRNPSYRRVRVEGHTDSRGNADLNRRLSMDRAQACVDRLVRAGIDPSRLYAQGLGPDRPLGDNATPEGRAANRRTEFHIEPVGPGSDHVTQSVDATESGEAPAPTPAPDAPPSP